MTDQLISFETAKLAKEKGFKNILLNSFYRTNGNFEKSQNEYDFNDRNPWPCELYAAPTQSLLQKWLREKHGIDIIIKPWTGDKSGEKVYAADITIFGTNKYIKCKKQSTYEKALEQGLIKALKLIKL